MLAGPVLEEHLKSKTIKIQCFHLFSIRTRILFFKQIEPVKADDHFKGLGGQNINLVY